MFSPGRSVTPGGDWLIAPTFAILQSDLFLRLMHFWYAAGGSLE